ncbi:MAG: alpha/beta hydrolase [Cyclobacteriaceae bacterium]
MSESKLNGIWNKADKSFASIILTHGAGAGMEHPFMTNLAEQLALSGINVFRFNFPYIERGKRVPGSPKENQQAIIDAVKELEGSNQPLFVGGKSYGGRMASHCAADNAIQTVKGLVFFGFPLHAPGRDSKDRASHLADVGIPMLFLQGTGDKLANIDLISEVNDELGSKATLKTFQSADHSFKMPKKLGIDQLSMTRQLADQTQLWMKSIL